ncbi:MAG: hypothetical protein M3Q07_04130 [Pseudobdellovibrionaceae bacterium]|nr:hypothetical protein [Pseudobdellovibrionaceae bacterium]
MNITFEHDYQQKILSMRFAEPTTIGSDADVMNWRQTWLNALKSWHSPYKAVIDGSQLRLGLDANEPAIKAALGRMEKVLSGFFLKKAVIWGIEKDFADLMPFAYAETEDAAWEAIGQRKTRGPAEPVDFRSSIQLQNHFRQHVVELSFSADAVLDSKEKLQAVRSKLTNNLMQWHSAWSMLIDCTHLEISAELHADWELMVKFFRGFFLKEVLGYTPKRKDLAYPFQVYRARHNAAGRLEGEGLFSGEDADCKSRKS